MRILIQGGPHRDSIVEMREPLPPYVRLAVQLTIKATAGPQPDFCKPVPFRVATYRRVRNTTRYVWDGERTW